MRRFLLAAAVLLVPACGNADQSVAPEVDRRAAEFARLNNAVADVAEQQAQADPALAEHLEILRRLDGLIEELRDPEQVDAAKERFAPLATRFEELDADHLKQQYRQLAFEVDEARGALNRARQDVTDEWEAEYLDAQNDVLAALRGYAQAADALAQVLGTYRELYAAIAEETRIFVEQRWFYRTSQEAADAYELAIEDQLSGLSEARKVIADFTAERDEAAVAVNQATADAAAVWARRPGDASAGTTPRP